MFGVRCWGGEEKVGFFFFLWGRCGRSDVVLPLPGKLQFISLDSVRLLMISLETHQWHLGFRVGTLASEYCIMLVMAFAFD